MQITFLGSGGGRFVTISQKRMTGGFRLDDFGGVNLHVDPGPGALIRSHQFGFNPTKLNGIFISHTHTDHYNDAEIMIEAMTRGMTRNRGLIIGSESVCNGYEKWGPAISTYHQSKSQVVPLKIGKVEKLDKFVIRGSKTIHGDPTGVGFQMSSGGIKLSYTSDTEYFKNLHIYHKNADILIASVLRPGSNTINGHMCSDDFITLINEVKPKLAILTHFGYKMLEKGPIKEALRITKETGVKTLAAMDGLTIKINKNNIKDSIFHMLSSKRKKRDIFNVDVENKNSYLGLDN